MSHIQSAETRAITGIVAVVDTGYWPHPALDYNPNGQGRVLVQYDAMHDRIDAAGCRPVSHEHFHQCLGGARVATVPVNYQHGLEAYLV